jgi:uncharacterized protein DUF4388/PilZ domain-containing protein
MNERRSAKRVSHICEVECENAGVARICTRITDLSATGAFIDTVTCYPPGTQLRLKFKVQDVIVEAMAEVRYSMPQMGMGVRFSELRPEHLVVLESFCEGKPAPRGSTAELVASTAATVQPKNLLLGSFSLVNVFDVIQMIENSRLTGALTLNTPNASGEINFNDGEIVNAKAGQLTGLDALAKFLDVTEGSFAFRESPARFDRAIQAKSNTGLMLDLLSF